MANEFILTLSNGDTLVSIPEGTVDTNATSLALHGRGRANYGQQRDQNLVNMLENFADGAPPDNPLFGQIWFQKRGGSPEGTDDFFVWSGSPVGWRNFGGGTTPSTTPPPNPTIGDLWYDTDPSDDPWVLPQLKIWSVGSGSPETEAGIWESTGINYLPLTGGILTGGLTLGGNLAMGGFDITGADDITAIDTIQGSELIATAGNITANAGDITADVGDIEASAGNILGNRHRAQIAGAEGGPAFSWTKITNAGMYLAGSGSPQEAIRFSTNGFRKLEIGVTGDPLRVFSATGSPPGYAALVDAGTGDTIPNKRWVEDQVASVAFDTSTVPVLFFQNANPGGSAKNGDIWMDTNDVPSTYIRVNGIMRKIFPAVYS